MDLFKMKMESFKYFTIKESLEAAKEDGYALQYVQNQTEEICLEAVRQYGDALQYADISVLTEISEEMTLEDVCKALGKNIKIIK